MNFSTLRPKDVVKLFKNLDMKNTRLCLHEEAPLNLCLINRDYFILSERLEPPHGYEFMDRGHCIDGRVLGATDFSYGKFRPPGESEYEDIRAYDYYSGTPGDAIQNLKKLVEILPNAVNQIDINAAFDAGEYEVSSNKEVRFDIRNSNRKRKPGSIEDEVMTFSVGKNPKKLFPISAPLLRGLRDLGFSITGYELEEIDAPVIVLRSDLLKAIGVISRAAQTGITVAPDGRSISHDAGSISWISEEDALCAIDQEVSYFRPVRYGTIRSNLSVETIVQDRLCGLARPVSALRWRGYPEAEILKLVKRREYEAWYDIHKEILKRAKEKLESALAGTSNVPYLENQAKQLCGEFDSLQKLLTASGNPESLDYSILQQLVDALEMIKENAHEV